MNESTDILDRLAELETQAAFLEELHERLNQVVARQDRELTELKARVQDLASRLRDLGDALPDAMPGPAVEVPPHY